ncbi:putative quinol monooxygenase [Actinomadura madurae]|uniref:putative quinol monooxygenase n=1 Tax=Actinomadura madurae TaxID=1993 RepID=UPI0020D24A28|nr:antibiotic biosynthesis monooxygenase [Actinomadura madurae]MCP9969602.1 antibiotic biosynthesis monooxygenase [Actinomadura madurae]MCQ0006419.1 antibiotic biosynthesis monooxygenase [Actinomadura madurae]MCQ0018295.1 antibiotic biosynthesis monooxygenase [Actinomadura madurae]
MLIQRASKDRLLYLIAWSFTQVGLTLALLSMGVGFLAGFNGLLFRVMELGAALIGPVWLALGMIELIARYVQVRFAAWLFAISYTVVAIVILILDPLKGSLSKSLPKPGDTYDALPLLLIDGAHVVAVLALAGCTGVTAWLASKQDQEAAELLIPVALVALAGVLVVSGTRGFLPAPLAVIALGAAAGLVWYGAMRTIPVYDEEGYDDYEDEPATGYEEQGYAPASRPEPVPAPTPPPDQRRGELRFPEPSSEELRFPENTSIPVPAQPAYPESPASNPAGPTAVDGIGNALDQSPLAGLARPGALGGELANACGQITVYTLLDGRESAFDRLAADLVKAALAAEPETLIFASHEVVGAPTQRIFYQLFRDEAAFAAHRRQPHLQRFLAESRTHVIATNVIELKLGAAKVPLPAPEFPGR